MKKKSILNILAVKSKKIVIFSLYTLLFASLLCSCGAPIETKGENEGQIDEITETEIHIPKTETETTAETEPPVTPATLKEVIESVLPPLDLSSEDPEWQQKLNMERDIDITLRELGDLPVMEGKKDEDGKYTVWITLVALPSRTVADMIAARYAFDGIEMTEYESKNLCFDARINRLLSHYEIESEDVFRSTAGLIVYIPEEKIKELAKSTEVYLIRSGDNIVEAISRPTHTPVGGENDAESESQETTTTETIKPEFETETQLK